MGAIPGEVDPTHQPPMAIPLAHFLVGLAFLVAGGLVGVLAGLDLGPSLAGLAHLHLFLVGWVCLTIMGAMTQFVPVWSGVRLHSRTLAVAQLWIVTAGLVGFAAALLWPAPTLVPVFGTAMAAGVWVFAYNLGRSLARVDGFDVTERHFVLALAFFVLATGLGVVLAVDLAVGGLAGLPIDHRGLLGAHATLAVFGAVLTTVFGALYQLATMFTQSDLHGADRPLSRLQQVAYPIGVVSLSAGRLIAAEPLAAAGGALLATAVLAFAVILARRLVETSVEWTSMLSRYAVLAGAMGVWAVLALPAWLRAPLAPAARFGAPGTVHLLAVGVVGFVVLGTLYHVVPFIVWVHRYSDRLGLEPVPMIDDLYDDRLARADFACFLVGGVLLVAADLADLRLAPVGGVLLFLGSVLFAWNLLAVCRTHADLAAVFAGVGGDPPGPEPDRGR